MWLEVIRLATCLLYWNSCWTKFLSYLTKKRAWEYFVYEEEKLLLTIRIYDITTMFRKKISLFVFFVQSLIWWNSVWGPFCCLSSWIVSLVHVTPNPPEMFLRHGIKELEQAKLHVFYSNTKSIFHVINI